MGCASATVQLLLGTSAIRLQRLLRCRDPRTNPEQVLRFNYTEGPRYDTSLQQYGLLGLWSAQQSGIEVPVHAFAAAARHLVAVQGPAAGSVVVC